MAQTPRERASALRHALRENMQDVAALIDAPPPDPQDKTYQQLIKNLDHDFHEVMQDVEQIIGYLSVSDPTQTRR